jgi:competence protein ComEC
LSRLKTLSSKQIAPIAAIGVLFSSGILIARTGFLSFWPCAWLCASLVVLAAATLRKYICEVFLYTSFFMLGVLVFLNTALLPRGHIAELLPQIRGESAVEGSIANDPTCGNDRCSFILHLEKLHSEGYAVTTSGDAIVQGARGDRFMYGQRVVVPGAVRRPYNFSPDFDYRAFLAAEGIYCIVYPTKAAAIEVLAGSSASPVTSFAFRVRRAVRDIFFKNVEPVPAKFLTALILGQRQDLPAALQAMFIRTGTAHIIAVSGLHLVMVAFIALIMLKVLRIPKKPRYLLTIGLLVFYGIITDMRPSVERAIIMASMLLIGELLERPVSIYNSLSCAAFLILLLNPHELFSAGFQLSFACVVGIVVLSRRIEQPVIRFLGVQSRLAHLAVSSLSVSFSAWLASAPFVAFYFGIITPVTVLANFVIVPYVNIVMALGFLLAFAGLVAPFLAGVLGAANTAAVVLLFRLTEWFSHLPGSYWMLR